MNNKNAGEQASNGDQKKSYRETFETYSRNLEQESQNRNASKSDLKTRIEHGEFFKLILDEITPINEHELANKYNMESLQRKHRIQIVVKEVLRLANRRNLSVSVNNGAVFVYNGAYWKEVSREELKAFLGKAAIKMGIPELEAGYHLFRADLEKQFMSEGYLAKPNRTNDEVLINLSNGTLVITPHSQKLKDFDKNDFLTYQLKFSLDGDATFPIFDRYLDRVLPDKGLQMILAEFMGYVFVNHSHLKLEKALVLFGYGANGKSVFFEIMDALLGPEHISNFSLLALTNENGYYRAKIGNKLLNYASEISTRMDSTIFKQLVSGEPVDARLPNQNPFIIRDYAKLIFNTNELPKNVEQNEAFFRRFIIVPFDITIPENERDPELAKKIIESEMPGILNWVLAGLKRLLEKKKFSHSDLVQKAVNNYRQQSDSVQLFIGDSGYVHDPKNEVPLKTLYQEYKVYCEENGYMRCSQRVFSERLTRNNFVSKRKNFGHVVYVSKKRFDEPTQLTLPAPM